MPEPLTAAVTIVLVRGADTPFTASADMLVTVGNTAMRDTVDLYKDLLAHGVAEVIPNLSTHGHTNPLDVLALRWIDVVQSDAPLFDPGYTVA